MSSQNQTFDKTSVSKNQLDQFIKSKISVLDFQPPPIRGWSKSATWEIIKKQLDGNSNKNVIAWGMALAASLSLVVAASINFSSVIFSEIVPEELALSSPVAEPMTRPVAETNYASKKVSITSLDQIAKINTSVHVPLESNVLFPSPIQEVQLPVASGAIPSIPSRNTFIKPLVSLDHSALGSMPGLGFGVDFDIYSKMTGSIRKDLSVGLSTSFRQVANEQGSQVRSFTFLNMEYSRVDVNREKGWSVRTGILLNKGGNLYKNNAVKFSVNRQFNRHVKAGPEVIFTKNLTKIYPGVSIIFS